MKTMTRWAAFLCLSTRLAAPVSAQEAEWLRQINGDDFNEGLSAAMDRDGNAYAVIRGYGNVDVSGASINLGSADCLLIKYNPAGQPVWTRWLEGDGVVSMGGMAVGPDGNLYLAGTFIARVRFGQVEPGGTNVVALTAAGPGSYDVFLVKYDPAGHVIWARNYGGPNQEFCHSIAVDSTGQICLAGTFNSVGVFGDTIFPAQGLGRVWVARLDAAGNLLWVRATRSSSGAAETHGVAVDQDRNVYLTGGFLTDIDIGDVHLASAGQRDMFLAKYDANGELRWVRQGTGEGGSEGYDVVTDANGFVYVTGVLGAPQFGQPNSGTFNQVQVTGSVPFFLVKYDSAGNVIWGKNDGGEKLAIDEAGMIYGTGAFLGSRQFGSTFRSSRGYGDLYTVKWDGDGNVLWSQAASGPEQDNGGDIAVDPQGNSVMVGTWYITDPSKDLGAYMAPIIVRLSGGSPLIVGQPQDQIVPSGANAVFTVVPVEVAISSYQWLKNGVELADGTRVSGSTTDTLRISQVGLADEGNYSVRVVTPERQVLSAPARLRLSGLMRFVNTERLGNGTFQASFTGVTGRLYDVEWSTNLVNWLFLTNGYAVNGMMMVIDPGGSGTGRKFYRAVSH